MTLFKSRYYTVYRGIFRSNQNKDMKKTIPLAAIAMLGLSVFPVYADNASATKAATEAAATAEKIPVYIVVVSGKG